MRTSLNEIKQTEQYLQGQLVTEDALVFEARLLTSPLLRLNMLAQNKVYQLVKLYHRKKVKAEVQIVSEQLFNNPEKKDFQAMVFNLFNK